MSFREILGQFRRPSGHLDLPDISVWRSRLVDLMLIIAVCVFPISMAVTFPVFLEKGHHWLLVVDVALFLYILYLFFIQRGKPGTRFLVAVVFMYVLSVSFMVALGPGFARAGWLVALVVVGAFLMGTRASMILVLINAVTLMAIYVAMSVLNPEWLTEHGVTLSNWVMFVVNISGLSVGCGLPVGYLLSGLDRSLREERAARQRLEAALIELKDEVAAREKLEEVLGRTQKLEAVGRFASNIAHDLNNMFAPVLAYTQLAKRSLEDPEKAAAHLEQISISTAQATEMVSQILSFGRQSDTPRELLELREVLEGFASRLDLPDKIRLEIETEPTEAMVRVNRTEIEQLLTNLIGNAVAAMEPGSGTLKLSLAIDDQGPEDIRDRAPNGWHRLEVSDTGCGMDEQTAARAFDPFFTTRDFGKGTGLGLAIAHGIVSGYGGRIDFHTERSRGTTFVIHLPLESR